ncbi:MAG: GC-type dockerin domain-anchored protein, partial [Candidatus Latescibacteria bacterium]|nr:GC-type dockerin domain-anchored protein [Candidatus Latescibacterota bacterium]
RIRELTVQFDLATLFAPQEKTIDFNADGRLDFNDFLLFINAFDTTNPSYDLDADGLVGFGDFLRFVNAYETGQITVRP